MESKGAGVLRKGAWPLNIRLRSNLPFPGEDGVGPLSALCSRWPTMRRMGEDAPIPALAPKLEAQSLRFCQARPQGGAQKKGPRLVVLRLLRLWPLLLLTPYRRARAAD